MSCDSIENTWKTQREGKSFQVEQECSIKSMGRMNEGGTKEGVDEWKEGEVITVLLLFGVYHFTYENKKVYLTS